MAPLLQANFWRNRHWKQLENARSIQIVSNNTDARSLSVRAWLTGDSGCSVSTEGRGHSGGGGRGTTDEIIQFVLTRKQKRYLSLFLMVRSPCVLQPSSATRSSSYAGLRINLLMDVALHALPKVVLLFAFSNRRHMPSYTKRKLSGDSWDIRQSQG